MKALLRNSSTGQYFQGLERWTMDRDEAYDFGIIGRALRFAHAARIDHLELVLSFDQAERDPAIAPETLRFRAACLRGGGSARKPVRRPRGCRPGRGLAKARA